MTGRDQVRSWTANPSDAACTQHTNLTIGALISFLSSCVLLPLLLLLHLRHTARLIQAMVGRFTVQTKQFKFRVVGR